jgi:hypothetical protein
MTLDTTCLVPHDPGRDARLLWTRAIQEQAERQRRTVYNHSLKRHQTVCCSWY